jgi:hypothetical protein
LEGHGHADERGVVGAAGYLPQGLPDGAVEEFGGLGSGGGPTESQPHKEKHLVNKKAYILPLLIVIATLNFKFDCFNHF